MKNYSIKDIAEISGVSVATVSRVINNNGRFSEKTKQKVLKAIEETGYKMNYSAKSLRMNKSFSIGILVPDIRNFFFSNVVQKIEEILFEKGYSTIICNTARNEKKETAYLQMLQGKGVDGLIVISGAEAFEFDYTSNKQIPYICIDREPKQKEKTIFISSNHYQGAVAATEQLIITGCKHPVIAMYTTSSSSSNARLKGFTDTLNNHGFIYCPKNHLLSFDHHTIDYYQNFSLFLQKNPKTDGIFALNDTIALELLTAASQLAKSVPDQLKIIGFDDTPCAKYATPTLSSVKQDTDTIAASAVEALLGLLSHNEINGHSIEVPIQLILRDSSK